MTEIREMTPTAMTSQESGGTMRHYKLADGRGVAVQRTYRRGKHMVLVTVKAVHGGDYRTPTYTRYFDLVKGEGEWKVSETGWTHNIGGERDDDDIYETLKVGGFRTRQDAQDYAVNAALDGRLITRG